MRERGSTVETRAEPKPNPADAYGVAYLKLPWGASSRWENDHLFKWLANNHVKIMRALGWGSFLDVGCGRGWVVKNVRDLNFQADGLEYGTGAVQHSVCAARFGDLTQRLPVADNSYDYVACVGVITHIPPEAVPNAVRELARVARHGISVNIHVLSKTRAGLPSRPDVDGQARALGADNKRTMEDRTWWWRQFTAAGLGEHPRAKELVEWGGAHEQFSTLLMPNK